MKTPQIHAVVFDMDGTMFNTESIYDEVSEIVLSRRGKHFTRELKLKMMGLPSKEAFRVMVDHCQLKDSIELLSDETHRLFAKLLPQRIELMPGMANLLECIEARDIPKAVATSSTSRFAQLSLTSCKIEDRFEFVLTSEDVTLGKPHPEIYLLAAKKLQIETGNMLVLEDSPIGSQAAVAAGAFTVAVPNEHTRHFQFEHVDHRIESLESEWLRSLFAE